MGPKIGFIKILDGNKKDKQIEILYFPPEYSLERSNTFSEIAIPGLESPYLQFVKGNAGSITIEVFYDTYEKGTDVREITSQLTDLLNIDPTIHAPPPLQFIWGLDSKEPFNCVLERVTKKFTMFNSDGVPVRARLNITLKEFKMQLNSRERELQSPDKTKVYIAKQGDSLWAIAYREYGDPDMWRPIAQKNNIYDPRFLKPGTELVIPPLE
ncbi:MAG: LysM peptidoglycan-binding domain-containing protein [Candidatus Methanoperedens sp.]|uniref:CIS tube protein n=1 Tax=Candidatus Methanoperedens sp. BLZ2 TaxID=2035255 RepID=UPI000BE32EE5|nr:LysM peptidoglycan-binding domain-containing protein [Candidatus Methanoperedens sp. BLZ2]KAB2944599.1 MAG: LysM peptidoglycan-binding domain-containing protein [Candidatus Methanoperedens sp.]MBZ0176866.1 LysM peptidoglycan-binding domain-containing protein [Candidatus Methanoperedens nitroreducens]MCX9077099.1 LysM peptidoglycan-binding domain-containing protein [Candidatus Methanoperedens sp.]